MSVVNNLLESAFGKISHILPNRLNKLLTATYFTINTFVKFGLRGTHSSATTCTIMPDVRVRILPALTDNYMFLIIDDIARRAVVIDPVDSKRVLDAVDEEKIDLVSILTTHHHWDHAGGNLDLQSKTKNRIPVYGGDERIDGLTDKVGHETKLDFGGSLQFRCLFTPCHTTGHICYFWNPGQQHEQPMVFTGDTLFLAGCGKFFEGNGEQMQRNLNEILAGLPDTSQVFCGHEYSVSSLKFASQVEPNNEAVKLKLAWCEAQRAAKLPTIPSTLAEEKSYNPFMRVHVDSVQRWAEGGSNLVATMSALRSKKDSFKAT